MIFANIIKPNHEMPPFDKFFAANLSGMTGGQPYQRIFYKSNMPDIEVIDKNEALKRLMHGK